MPMPTLQGYFEGGIPGEEEEEDRAGGRAAGCRECLLRCVQRAPLPRCSWTWARRCSRSATTWASSAAPMPCGARCCTSTPGSWKLGAPPARPVLQVQERAPPAAPSDTSRRSSPWRRCITTGFTPHLLLRYCSCSRFSRLPHVLRGGWSCVEDKYELSDEAGRRRTLWEPRPIEEYLHPSRSRSSCLIRLGTERRGGRRGRGRLRGWGGGRRGQRLHFLHVPGGWPGADGMGCARLSGPATCGFCKLSIFSWGACLQRSRAACADHLCSMWPSCVTMAASGLLHRVYAAWNMALNASLPTLWRVPTPYFCKTVNSCHTPGTDGRTETMMCDRTGGSRCCSYFAFCGGPTACSYSPCICAVYTRLLNTTFTLTLTP